MSEESLATTGADLTAREKAEQELSAARSKYKHDWYENNKKRLLKRAQKRYQANRKHILEYGRQRFEANRERLLEYGRQWKRAKRQAVSHEELAECVADIRKAKTIRGDDWIICLGRKEQPCGQMLKALTPVHLREHGFQLNDEYKDHWGYSRRTPLCSENYSASWRERAKQIGTLVPGAGVAHLRPRINNGQKMSLECSLKLSALRSGKARPDIQTSGVSDAGLIDLYLIRQQSIVQISQRTGLSLHGIHGRLQRILGIRLKNEIRFAHGEPVTVSTIHRLRATFGLTVRKLAHISGISEKYLYVAANNDKGLALTTDLADKLLATERRLLELFTDGDSSPRLNRIIAGKQLEYIRGIFQQPEPRLSRMYEIVRAAIADVRERVSDEKQITEFLANLCAESRKEVVNFKKTGAGQFKARTVICYLPQLLTWLSARKDTLTQWPSELAYEFLGEDYGLKPHHVKQAMTDGASMAKETLQAWSAQLERPRKRTGPKPTPVKQTEKYILAAMVNAEIPDLELLLREVANFGPKKPGIEKHLKAKFSDVQIAAVLKPTLADNVKIAARRLVSAREQMGYDTVARYHQQHQSARPNSSE